jgi:predicted NUDIX family NTP pyrophosphohydrolase
LAAPLSAGILLHRFKSEEVEVLLVHFGGPYWANKDVGAWAIPKGLVEEGEEAQETARREFEEELGSEAEGALLPLGRIRQNGGKWVEAFAMEGDLDPDRIVSNSFTAEWPPRSGKFQSYPEVDRANWFSLEEARAMILPSQLPILDRFEAVVPKGGVS